MINSANQKFYHKLKKIVSSLLVDTDIIPGRAPVTIALFDFSFSTNFDGFSLACLATHVQINMWRKPVV